MTIPNGRLLPVFRLIARFSFGDALSAIILTSSVFPVFDVGQFSLMEFHERSRIGFNFVFCFLDHLQFPVQSILKQLTLYPPSLDLTTTP